MRLSILAFVATAAIAVGCTGTYHGTYRGGAVVSSGYYYNPDLVYVDHGVYAVAGVDYPVFYSDNFYWRFYGGRWYRSPYYDRGWAYASPPHVVARIDRPYRYRNYRPHGYIVHRDRGRTYYHPQHHHRGDRVDRGGGRGRVMIRDHRR